MVNQESINQAIEVQIRFYILYKESCEKFNHEVNKYISGDHSTPSVVLKCLLKDQEKSKEYFLMECETVSAMLKKCKDQGFKIDINLVRE